MPELHDVSRLYLLPYFFFGTCRAWMPLLGPSASSRCAVLLLQFPSLGQREVVHLLLISRDVPPPIFAFQLPCIRRTVSFLRHAPPLLSPPPFHGLLNTFILTKRAVRRYFNTLLLTLGRSFPPTFGCSDFRGKRTFPQLFPLSYRPSSPSARHIQSFLRRVALVPCRLSVSFANEGRFLCDAEVDEPVWSVSLLFLFRPCLHQAPDIVFLLKDTCFFVTSGKEAPLFTKQSCLTDDPGVSHAPLISSGYI